jgi:hypothetical protein
MEVYYCCEPADYIQELRDTKLELIIYIIDVYTLWLYVRVLP